MCSPGRLDTLAKGTFPASSSCPARSGVLIAIDVQREHFPGRDPAIHIAMAYLIDEEHFWKKVDIRDSNDCWLWKGATDRDGYGRHYIRGEGSRKGAHRLAYEFVHGPIPENHVIRHTLSCTSRACCNPAHLVSGSQAENMKDREGAGQTPRGARNGRSKLNPEKVRAIRRAVDRGSVQADLARRYGVDKTVIRDVVKRKMWRHV